MNGLRTAVGFLTRIPITTPRVELGAAAPWFPVVGLLVGLAHGGAYAGLAEVVPALPAAAVASAIAALITGAFHHDGLADMADGFGGGWDVEQRLAILKDSRLGTYGTVALILAVVTEVTTVASLGPRDGFTALVAAHTLSRAIAVGSMFRAPLAGDGLGAAYAADLGPVGTGIAVTGGVAVTIVALGWHAVAAVAAAVVVAVLVRILAARKIGGITGDVLGAIQQLTALAVLLAAAAQPPW